MPGKKGKSKPEARKALRVADALEQMESRRRKPAPGKRRSDLDLDFIP